MRTIIPALAWLVLPCLAIAHQPSELATCSRIEDSLERLQCYDNLAESASHGRDAGCPISWTATRKADKSSSSQALSRSTCPEHMFVAFTTATTVWRGKSMSVLLGFKNDYQNDRTAILSFDYVQADGSVVPGGSGTANLDSGESGGVKFSFRMALTEVVEVRFHVVVAGG